MSLNKWKTNDLPKPDGRTPSTSFFWQTSASIIDFCSLFNLKLLSLVALVKAKSNALLNKKAIF